VTSEVLNRKKEMLIKYLEDLKVYQDSTYNEFIKNHYAIERILELLVIVSCDIIFHLISQQEHEIPTTYRTAFLRAGELNIITKALSSRLAEAAGMRNILVHDYGDIDYSIVHQSIKHALNDFPKFLVEIDK
jgi:uncharacterized protein YutE (UPF0331/DUF86 family)